MYKDALNQYSFGDSGQESGEIIVKVAQSEEEGKAKAYEYLQEYVYRVVFEYFQLIVGHFLKFS